MEAFWTGVYQKQSMDAMKDKNKITCTVTDPGDREVGMFPMEWSVDVPFSREDTDWKESCEFFRTAIRGLYAEFTVHTPVVRFDHEGENFPEQK